MKTAVPSAIVTALIATLAFTTTALGATNAVAAPRAATGMWKNCTAFNHAYPHGVGKTHAHDHTSGKPVTDFKHSTHLYDVAMDHNSRLDGDKDGVACEKA